MIYLIVIIFCLGVLYYLSKGAIYLPTHSVALKAMMDLVNLKPGMKVVDLGSGDGRVVIAFAQAGADATGYEIHPLLVWWSKWKIRKAGMRTHAKIIGKSFWNQDLSEYDVVIVFGINYIMEKLENKLKKELKPGTVVISNVFKFPTLKLVKEQNGVRSYEV